jgi:hypothetical protein
MALCGVGALAAMSLALRALDASVERTAAALAFFALAPLVLGSVILYRYDLWPAALMVAGLAAVLARRERLGFAAIGLGVAAKAFPAAMLPPARGLRLADARAESGARLHRCGGRGSRSR